MPVTENIMESIYRSKKTIVLMSNNFLRSMWGQFELQQAHNRAIIQVSTTCATETKSTFKSTKHMFTLKFGLA